MGTEEERGNIEKIRWRCVEISFGRNGKLWIVNFEREKNELKNIYQKLKGVESELFGGTYCCIGLMAFLGVISAFTSMLISSRSRRIIWSASRICSDFICEIMRKWSRSASRSCICFVFGSSRWLSSSFFDKHLILFSLIFSPWTE